MKVFIFLNVKADGETFAGVTDVNYHRTTYSNEVGKVTAKMERIQLKNTKTELTWLEKRKRSDLSSLERRRLCDAKLVRGGTRNLERQK